MPTQLEEFKNQLGMEGQAFLKYAINPSGMFALCMQRESSREVATATAYAVGWVGCISALRQSGHEISDEVEGVVMHAANCSLEDIHRVSKEVEAEIKESTDEDTLRSTMRAAFVSYLALCINASPEAIKTEADVKLHFRAFISGVTCAPIALMITARDKNPGVLAKTPPFIMSVNKVSREMASGVVPLPTISEALENLKVLKAKSPSSLEG